MELGGFAEEPSVLDGSIEEYYAFNYGLAESYLYAMYDENFEDLGEMSKSLIKKIEYWLNYYGDIGQKNIDIIENISKGLIMTRYKRTFIDAIIANKNGNLAETFIYLENHDPRLYVTAILYGENVPYSILDNINGAFPKKSPEEIMSLYNQFFQLLEEYYLMLTKREDKIEFLKRIKPYTKRITISREYEEEAIKVIKKVHTYQWYKDSRNKQNNQI